MADQQSNARVKQFTPSRPGKYSFIVMGLAVVAFIFFVFLR